MSGNAEKGEKVIHTTNPRPRQQKKKRSGKGLKIQKKFKPQKKRRRARKGNKTEKVKPPGWLGVNSPPPGGARKRSQALKQTRKNLGPPPGGQNEDSCPWCWTNRELNTKPENQHIRVIGGVHKQQTPGKVEGQGGRQITVPPQRLAKGPLPETKERNTTHRNR